MEHRFPWPDQAADGGSGSGSEACTRLHSSLSAVLRCTFTLEQAHREAALRYLRQIRYGSKDNPIGDENYLLLKSRMKDYLATAVNPNADANESRDNREQAQSCS